MSRRPTKKINGDKKQKKITSIIGNLDPPPPPLRFLFTPELDNPRFNAIAYQNLKRKENRENESVLLKGNAMIWYYYYY